MPTAHERAVASALVVNRELGAIFGRLGTADHPRGAVLTAYRQARRALDGNLRSSAVVADVLATLRMAVIEAVRAAMRQAADVGSGAAEKQLQVYGFQPVLPGFNVELPVSAVRAVLEGQLANVTALTLTGVGLDMVLGDDERVGILSAGKINAEAARWAAVAAAESQRGAFDSTLRDEPEQWQKQWVSALDDRTTDCCLRAHGQTVPRDEPFVLTGTPRYADRVDSPPGHWY